MLNVAKFGWGGVIKKTNINVFLKTFFFWVKKSISNKCCSFELTIYQCKLLINLVWIHFYFLYVNSHSLSLSVRVGQNRVPTESWKSGDLPESLWPHRALLWSRGRGCQSGTTGGWEPAAVSFPAAGGPHGGLPAITSLLTLPGRPLPLHPSLHPIPVLKHTSETLDHWNLSEQISTHDPDWFI